VLVPDVPDLPADAGELRELLARLRAVVEAKDTEVTMPREQCRRLELEVAERLRVKGGRSALRPVHR
jgi:hypothetical protein